LLTKILKFGVIVSLNGTSDTEFIHISKLSDNYIANISDSFKIGETLTAICIQGRERLELSVKSEALEKKNSSKTLDEMIADADNVMKDKLRHIDLETKRRRKSKFSKQGEIYDY
jgi:S1 RNA binding domain protein